MDLLKKHRKSTIGAAAVYIAADRSTSAELVQPMRMDAKKIDACANEVMQCCHATPNTLEELFPNEPTP